MAIAYDGSFADSLGPAPPVTPAARPPPVPPKMGFFDVLAGAFGGGPDRVKSFDKGLDQGSQMQLRSAQTTSALAEADKRRAEALRQSQITDLVTKAQSDPSWQPSVSDLLTISTGAGDFGQGRLHGQEFDQRAAIGNTATPQDQRLADMEAVSGRPVERYYDSGAGMQASQLVPGAAPVVTPVGQAQIDNYHELPASSGAGGRAPNGYRYTADGNMEFVPGGPQDPARISAVAAARVAGKPGTAGGKGLTEFQVKALSQLSRMDRTEQILQQDFKGYAPGLADVAVDKVPLAGNYMVSEQYQQYKQAAKEWISGLLRLDSGAAVPDSEFTTYFQTFFPQPGDDDTVVAQKADARTAATSALRQGLPQVAAAVDASRPGAVPPAVPGAPPAAGAPLRKTSKSGKPIISNDGGQTWEYE